MVWHFNTKYLCPGEANNDIWGLNSVPWNNISLDKCLGQFPSAVATNYHTGGLKQTTFCLKVLQVRCLRCLKGLRSKWLQGLDSSGWPRGKCNPFPIPFVFSIPTQVSRGHLHSLGHGPSSIFETRVEHLQMSLSHQFFFLSSIFRAPWWWH